jgi:hypothetical protein
MIDAESASRDGELRKLELPTGTVAACTNVGGGEGYSGERMAVGDSTKGTGFSS